MIFRFWPMFNFQAESAIWSMNNLWEVSPLHCEMWNFLRYSSWYAICSLTLAQPVAWVWAVNRFAWLMEDKESYYVHCSKVWGRYDFFSLITDLIKTIVKLYNCIVPVAQWLEHCVSSAKVVGSILREHMYWQKIIITWITLSRFG